MNGFRPLLQEALVNKSRFSHHRKYGTANHICRTVKKERDDVAINQKDKDRTVRNKGWAVDLKLYSDEQNSYVFSFLTDHKLCFEVESGLILDPTLVSTPILGNDGEPIEEDGDLKMGPTLLGSWLKDFHTDYRRMVDKMTFFQQELI